MGRGGLPGEGVIQVGFTVLQRNNLSQTVTAWAFTDGMTSTIDAFATLSSSFSGAQGTDDTFFSFVAPDGKIISSILLEYGTATTGDTRHAIDDLGFIINVVPEPASFAMLGLGLAMLGRRRR